MGAASDLGQRQATAWLWVYFTGGDHLLSPAFAGRNSESDREAYRTYVSDVLPALEDILRAYGRRLMDLAAKNSR